MFCAVHLRFGRSVIFKQEKKAISVLLLPPPSLLPLSPLFPMPPACCCYCGRRIPKYARLIEATSDEIIQSQIIRGDSFCSPLKHAKHVCGSCKRNGPSTPRPPNIQKVQEQFTAESKIRK